MAEEKRIEKIVDRLTGRKAELFIYFCAGLIPEDEPCAVINMERYPYAIYDELVEAGFL